MAETVQYQLERMLPELDELEKHQVFSPIEIKSIVKKRTNFEYALHRRIKKKIDFLRCIEYEMNLEKLRAVRIKKLDIDDKLKTKLQYADRRVFNLFERTTKRFPGDISLWLQYIDYAKTKKSNNILSSIYVQAIKYHPRNVSLWILAASWEFDNNANISAARLLLQRALRLNTDSHQLWHEYFRLELMYIEKIKLRRKVLGLDRVEEKMEIDTTDSIQLPEITAEEAAEWKDQTAVNKLSKEASDAMEHENNPILQGLLAKIAYNNAIIAIPDDLLFRIEFIHIYHEFTNTQEAIEEVYVTIERDMNQNPSARAFVAKKYLTEHKLSLDDPAFIPALKKSIDAFDKAVDELRVSAMWEEYMLFLFEWFQTVTEEHLKLYLQKYLHKKIKECEKQEKMSSKLYEIWVSFLLLVNDKVQPVLKRALSHYPHSITLWKYYIHDQKDDAVWTLFKEALELNPESYELWSEYKDRLMKRYEEGMDMTEVDSLFNKACSSATLLLPSITKETEDRNKIKTMLQVAYIEWASKAYSIQQTRSVYKSIIQQYYPSHEFIMKCIEIENQLGSKEDHVNVEDLYERLVRTEPTEASYLAYLSYLYSQKMFVKANLVYHNACKHTPKESFDIKLQSMNKH